MSFGSLAASEDPHLLISSFLFMSVSGDMRKMPPMFSNLLDHLAFRRTDLEIDKINRVFLNKMTEIFSYTACRQLSQLFASIIFFHVSEYILAIFFHGRSNVALSSLLFSKNYVLAMVFSLLEYFVEITFFPGMKELWWVSNFGLLLIIVGEIIRKMAVITAGRAFTHLIRIYHVDDHRLITHGIYAVVRHPGYCGFFIWSVGTPVMLCNPISTLGFAVVVWNFFARRIPYEEFFLRQFFGPDYEEYASTVPSGVPFVK